MGMVVSADKTRIAYSVLGKGPTVVVVDGALCYRRFGPSQALAKELGSSFTVYTYDRRGRGESGDASAYSPDREIEDLAAIITVSGGSAVLVGTSSGAALAIAAADKLGPKKVVGVFGYEAPFFTDAGHSSLPSNFISQMNEHIKEHKPGRAVKMFMRLVGTPAPFVIMMSIMPMWKQLCGVAHTLPYDFAFMAPYQQGKPLPKGMWSGATMPVMVAVGGKSPGWMKHSQEQLAEVLPNGELSTIAGQTHMISAPVLAEVVKKFTAPVAA